MIFYRVCARYTRGIIYAGYSIRYLKGYSRCILKCVYRMYRGVKYSILQVLYQAFYEYSIGHSTEYSIGYSIKYI